MDYARSAEVQGPVTLGVGNIVAKLWEWLGHADFFMSLNEDHFRTIYTFWSSSGWLVLALGAAVWAVIALGRVRRGETPLHSHPTWPLALSLASITFLVGVLWAGTSTTAFPQIITAHSSIPNVCSATLDTSRLLTFRKDYKVALVCYLNSASQDPLLDTNIAISNPFTIIPGSIAMEGAPGPGAPKPPPAPAPQPVESQATPKLGNLTVPPKTGAVDVAKAINPGNIVITQVQGTFVPVLIPNNVPRDKINSLQDVLDLGGKILDSRWYN